MPYVMFRLVTGAGGMAAQYSKATTLLLIKTWAKEYEVEFEHDTAGYELHIHFKNFEDLSFFCLNPPKLPQNYAIVE